MCLGAGRRGETVFLPKMKRFWQNLYGLLTWTPGNLVCKFWNSKVRSLYGDFLFLNYDNQFLSVLLVNVIVHLTLGIAIAATSSKMDWISFATSISSILFHVTWIGLGLWKRFIIRKTHFLGAALSHFLFTVAIEKKIFLLSYPQLFVMASFMIFLNITIFFQNSTLLMVILCLIQLGLVVLGYHNNNILPFDNQATIVRIIIIGVGTMGGGQ